MNNGPTPEGAGPDRHKHSQTTARDGQSHPSTPDHDPTLLLAFAEAIAMPGTTARYLRQPVSGGNTKVVAERSDLARASASGRPFMVYVARNVLAIDADNDEQQGALRIFYGELEADRRAPVLIRSGRGLHLFAKMPVGAARRWGVIARDASLDVRREIRPPLSPHTAGRPVKILRVSVKEALRRLSGMPVGPAPISGRMVDLLNCDGVHSYPSDSEPVQALATAMMAVGWPKEQFVAALTGQRHWKTAAACHGGEEWLNKSWSKAREYLKAQDREEDALLAALKGAADSVEWNGAGGRRDRTLLDAHHRAAFDSPNIHHILTTADAAIALGVSERTVRNARSRLQSAGWLVKEAEGAGAEAAMWSLTVPSQVRTAGADADAQTCRPVLHTPLPSADTATGRTIEDREASTRALIRDLGHDAFRVKALGKWAPQILAVMIGARGETLSGVEIARRCAGRPHAETVRRALRRMREASVVTQSTTGWVLVNLSEAGLRSAASIAGTDGTHDRQEALADLERQRRAAERSQWRSAHGPAELTSCAHLGPEDAPWLPINECPGEVVHARTGERTTLRELRAARPAGFSRADSASAEVDQHHAGTRALCRQVPSR